MLSWIFIIKICTWAVWILQFFFVLFTIFHVVLFYCTTKSIHRLIWCVQTNPLNFNCPVDDDSLCFDSTLPLFSIKVDLCGIFINNFRLFSLSSFPLLLSFYSLWKVNSNKLCFILLLPFENHILTFFSITLQSFIFFVSIFKEEWAWWMQFCRTVLQK